jgi:hypothetical protein
LAVTGQLAAKVVADGNGARLEGSASLAAGSYTLYARRDGRLWPTARSLVVDDAGRTQFG